MTRQEAFDTVAKHLAEQGACSTRFTANGSIFCAYRGHVGMKCAIGILIPDRIYNSYSGANKIEGVSIRALSDRYKHSPQMFDPFCDFWRFIFENETFFTALQNAHDSAFFVKDGREAWLSQVARNLLWVAEDFNLSPIAVFRHFPEYEG